MATIQQIGDMLKTHDGEIVIASGEGEQGTSELYTGARRGYAILRRIELEREGGRWATAIIKINDQGGLDMISGAYTWWPREIKR